MGTNIQKTAIVLLLTICFILVSFSTMGSTVSFPPHPGDLREPFITSEIILENDIEKIPVFQPTDYSDEVITELIQGLSEPLVIGYIEDLVSFGPRVTGSISCDNAARYIFDEFQSMGLSVRYQNWSSSSSLYGANIEATLPGIDESSDEVFIVCGHYDSVPGSPGADDNGAGTTAVLASAYLMKDRSFNHTVRFVCFSGEEQGLYGSAYYAQDAAENNENIIGVLNADMMGYADNEENRGKVKVYDDEDASVWLTDYTTDVSLEYHDLIGLTVVPSGYTWGSDHYRFWEVGYNAIFYFEAKFNPYYHSPDDTLETMDTAYATSVSQLIVATLAGLAEPVDIQCPSVPVIVGMQKGKPDETYIYEISTIDPQDDMVYYLVDWGDDTDSGWFGPFDSGESASLEKSWDSRGIYQVRVKAKDAEDHESNWSSPYPVKMPYVFNRMFAGLRIWDLLQHFSFL